jgi:SEC-C motif-containing protein
MTLCPCTSNRPFSECCEPILKGVTQAPTAEHLVRARYSAFVLSDLDYVERTHAPEIRADFNRAEAERLADECEWVSLHIHSSKVCENIADVQYVVRIRLQGKIIAKASSSHFRRDDGEWLFVRSTPVPHLEHIGRVKIGRNDPCHCGSGKKFKKCCDVTTPTQQSL